MTMILLASLLAVTLLSILLWGANLLSYRVMCSQTLEHVDDPAAMSAELRRVQARLGRGTGSA